jgi:hypothetical protein
MFIPNRFLFVVIFGGIAVYQIEDDLRAWRGVM